MLLFFSYCFYFPSVWTLYVSSHLFKAQSALIGQLSQAWAGIAVQPVIITSVHDYSPELLTN